jgi:hypothetical protein
MKSRRPKIARQAYQGRASCERRMQENSTGPLHQQSPAKIEKRIGRIRFAFGLVGVAMFLGFGAITVDAALDLRAYPRAPISMTVAEAAGLAIPGGRRPPPGLGDLRDRPARQSWQPRDNEVEMSARSQVERPIETASVSPRPLRLPPECHGQTASPRASTSACSEPNSPSATGSGRSAQGRRWLRGA